MKIGLATKQGIGGLVMTHELDIVGGEVITIVEADSMTVHYDKKGKETYFTVQFISTNPLTKAGININVSGQPQILHLIDYNDAEVHIYQDKLKSITFQKQRSTTFEPYDSELFIKAFSLAEKTYGSRIDRLIWDAESKLTKKPPYSPSFHAPAPTATTPLIQKAAISYDDLIKQPAIVSLIAKRDDLVEILQTKATARDAVNNDAALCKDLEENKFTFTADGALTTMRKSHCCNII